MEENLKQLLLKDLCARLPYNVIIDYWAVDYVKKRQTTLSTSCIDFIKYIGETGWKDCKPYLRPMSSMTKEERKEYEGFIIHREHINAQGQEWDIDCFSFNNTPRLIDWLNKHMFDYRGLIEKGLALEAPAGMYD